MAYVRWMLILAAAALALQGCGGSNQASQIQASLKALHTAFARRDAAAACGEITGNYWTALRDHLNGELEAAGAGPLPAADCTRDLRFVFANTSVSPTTYVLGHIAVHGDTATGTVGVNGGTPGFARFLRGRDGRWRVDCCTGSQVDNLPQGHYRVTSDGMLPTLKMGQLVNTDNAAMRAHPPMIDDIIVFHPPTGADGPTAQCGNPGQGAGHPQVCDAPTGTPSAQTFVKRVVGLPGDRIAMVAGHVIRNGVREREPFISACGGGPAPCTFPKPVVIPGGEYFVLGDNRGGSDDSRFWGPVPRAWIIGLVRP